MKFIFPSYRSGSAVLIGLKKRSIADYPPPAVFRKAQGKLPKAASDEPLGAQRREYRRKKHSGGN
ncbi:MAG: hypothetical protein MJ102_01165 [Clostridia bacterium]|nr:hypothetical protein [Clostridia bacterium]